MIIATLNHSAKILSILPIFCDIKIRCPQSLLFLAEYLRNVSHSRIHFRYSYPLLISYPKNPIQSTEMEFGRKHFPPLRKIFWKRRKSPKNYNKINSSAPNAETVQQNLSSDVDSGSMISSYRDVVANADKLKSEGRNVRKLVSDIRQDVYTPYGKWIKHGWLDERAKDGTFIKVVSYNILAQSLLNAHPELYSECNKDHLTWSHRSFLLISELNRFNADILCLQEVEADQLDFFNTQLGEFGYKGIFKKRTNGKDDGCAIYYKIDKFNLRECISVEYYQPGIDLLNRDNIGIVLRLSPKHDNSRCIVVATTHLLFNPKRHDIKLAQMQLLLAEIDRVAFKSSNNCNEPSYYPIILTGDLNLKPYTIVYNLLVNGTVESSQRYKNYNFRRDHSSLLATLGVTDACQHYHVTQNRPSDRSEISDFQYVKLYNSDRRSLRPPDTRSNQKPGSGSLYHNLNLTSAYSHVDSCARDVTTHQDEWCNVDYIFYGPTQKIDDSATKRVDGELKLVSYLRLPDCDQATCIGRMPNEACPSDHLPLAATFHLPVDVETPPKMTCKF